MYTLQVVVALPHLYSVHSIASCVDETVHAQVGWTIAQGTWNAQYMPTVVMATGTTIVTLQFPMNKPKRIDSDLNQEL